MDNYSSRANIKKSCVFYLAIIVGVIMVATPQVWAQLEREGDTLITVGEEGNSAIPTPAPTYDAAVAHEIEYVSTELSTLQETLPFHIFQPTHLPNDLVLSDVHQVTNSVDEERSAELIYSSPTGGWLSITQSQPLQPLKITIPDSQILQRTDINGQSGLIYDPGGPADWERRGILVWHEGERWFEMRSNFTYEELVAIARSLSS